MCDFSMSVTFLDDESGQDITSVFGGKSDAIRKGSSTPIRLKSSTMLLRLIMSLDSPSKFGSSTKQKPVYSHWAGAGHGHSSEGVSYIASWAPGFSLGTRNH